MQFSESRNVTRWILIIISFTIVVLILWNTYTFFQIFKNEERIKMEFWAQAQKTVQTADLETDLELPLSIISNNTSIPIILTNEKDSIITLANIDEFVSKDSVATRSYLEKLKNENDPIVYEYIKGNFRYLYYGNSSLLNQLKYYPIALILIIFLFLLLMYTYYRSSKMAAQNKLWAGMAKETAHQIGTPLSSLIGWLEIMRADDVEETTVIEIEKDINRLQTITDRFSKIGSEPVVTPMNIITETEQSYTYLKSRFSHQVEFTFSAPNTEIISLINPELHSWTIENLVKNAIDAMRGKGKVSLEIIEEDSEVKIYISDTGKGIPKKEFKKVFEPGFTTKKRGWGLGLSLTRRIVEEYHKGKIKVYNSEIGKGTTMLVALKKHKP